MRTTLTLDDDLAGALKKLAQERDQPFKRVVNDTLRAGLRPDSPHRPYEPLAGWQLQIEDAFGHMDGIRNSTGEISMNRLAAALEDEAVLAKIREGR